MSQDSHQPASANKNGSGPTIDEPVRDIARPNVRDNARPVARRVRRDAHFSWFDKGWRDLKSAWQASLALGTLVLGVSAALVSLMLYSGFGAYVPVACGLFILIGPLLAVACYGVSARLENGEKVSGPSSMFAFLGHAKPLLAYGAMLVILAFVWVRLALFLLAHFGAESGSLTGFTSWALETPKGLWMLVIGTIIGAILALAAFALSFVGLPLIAHRGTNPFVAMEVSVEAVLANPWVGLGFAFVIALSMAGSMVLGFLPLIIVFPWLGFASWHAYRALVE